MKIRTMIAVACLAVFGFVQAADAPSHHPRRQAAKKTISTLHQGMSTSTADVNGDGQSDVVTVSKPKRKPQ
jgi:hypothetical protein